MKKQTDKKIENFLSRNIMSVKDFPYQLIIKSLFGKEVKKFNTNRNADLLNQIAKAMKDICSQPKPINKLRRNEAGNAIGNCNFSFK